MKHLFYLLFLVPMFVHAQNPCGTVTSKEQMDKLFIFQQTLDTKPRLMLNKTTKYVPIKVHIVGNDKGAGYYRIDLLIASICKINRDFSPIGVQFYIKDDIQYINNKLLYTTDDNELFSITESYKDPAAVNVFFAGSNKTYCGVYYGGLDVVYIINSCQGLNATTLTHELGHFFSLPHTFYGWENNTTPASNQQEKIDGTNCRNTADRFCDTKPDYISERWDCSGTKVLTDPNGVNFTPDSSIFMNYSLDVCHSRFSSEQYAAMENNIANRGIVSQNLLATNPSMPTLLYPLDNDTNQNAQKVRLVWNKAEGATSYQLQVARLKLWESAYINVWVTDTFYDAVLFGDWQFDWRIKPMSLTNMCGDYSESKSFFAKVFPVGSTTEILSNNHSITIYPNPASNDEKIKINSSSAAQLIVYDINGREVFSTNLSKGETTEFTAHHAGLYLLQFKYDDVVLCKKIIVE